MGGDEVRQKDTLTYYIWKRYIGVTAKVDNVKGHDRWTTCNKL